MRRSEIVGIVLLVICASLATIKPVHAAAVIVTCDPTTGACVEIIVPDEGK